MEASCDDEDKSEDQDSEAGSIKDFLDDTNIDSSDQMYGDIQLTQVSI